MKDRPKPDITCLLNKIINTINNKDNNLIHTKVSCAMEIYHKTVITCVFVLLQLNSKEN